MAAPVVLIATPGAPNANSYASLTEADAYNAGVIGGEAWDADTIELDTKRRALITATRLLDTNVRWRGEAVSSSQALQWPRYFVRDGRGFFLSSTVIPPALRDATAELARRLLIAGTAATSDDDTANLKKLKAGPVELEFKDQAVSTGGAIDDDVLLMVAALAAETAGASVRSVPVRRS